MDFPVLSAPARPLTDTPATILIVDDVPENLRLLSMTLARAGYDVRNAINGNLAMMAITVDPPDLILLDISMPDIDGFEVCRQLKGELNTSEIPIIFITALGEALDKVTAFEVGGADYITKPFQIAEVLARVQHQLELRNLKNQLRTQNQKLKETLRQQQEAEVYIRKLNQDLEQRVVKRTQQLQSVNESLRQEMNEKQQAQTRLLHMAMYDSLTGLANRNLLLEELEQTLSAVHQSPSKATDQTALLLVDCDRFAAINDTLGHSLGDQLLAEIANRIVGVVPHNSLVSRLGGDEFAVLAQSSNIHALVKTLQKAFAVPISLDGYEVTINPSIGIVITDARYQQAEHLLRDANQAMVSAKKQKAGDNWRIFEPEMRQRALRRLSLEAKMRRAIEQQEFQVYYQPIVALNQNGTYPIVGFEALIRWPMETEGKFISPEELIPLAEETGMIVPLGDWVLETACQQLSQWHQTYTTSFPLFMCVNCSMHQFYSKQFTERVLNHLNQHQIQPQHFKIEITESIFMQDSQIVLESLSQLQERGIQVSIDDFGTGYSSLSYLRKLPINTLKIDRSFVEHLESEPESLGILEAIQNLAQAINVDSVAEGIETEYQARQLTQLGCSLGQGYWFSKPLDKEAAENFLSQNKSLGIASEY